MSQDEPRTLSLSLPKGGSQTQNGCFPSKIAFCSKKVCYKVSLCENSQRQSCRAFTGLTICAKMIGGDLPLKVNFALSKLLLGAADVLSHIVSNALFLS